MIDLYSWPTPNGRKIHIMLEETGTPYRVFPVNIGNGDQFAPEFLKISPNNKIPAMIDTEGPDGTPCTLFESGAMLMYLAEKTGQFMPGEMTARYAVIQWLMFQVGGIGPMFGQALHFLYDAPEDSDYAADRYSDEAGRLYGVMDRRLAENRYLAGEEYTIADIATFPWARDPGRKEQKPKDFPNVVRWLGEIEERPAVQRGLDVLTV